MRCVFVIQPSRPHKFLFLNTKTGKLTLTVTVHSLHNRRRRQISYIFVYPMRFRTIFLCVSIKCFFAFLAHFVIDALRFRNTASASADILASVVQGSGLGPAAYIVNAADLRPVKYTQAMYHDNLSSTPMIRTSSFQLSITTLVLINYSECRRGRRRTICD